MRYSGTGIPLDLKSKIINDDHQDLEELKNEIASLKFDLAQ